MFGKFMEATRVQDAALDLDPKVINQFDIGETHARTATEIRLGMDLRRTLGSIDEDKELPRTPIGHGVRMTQRELAELEAEEAAEDWLETHQDLIVVLWAVKLAAHIEALG